MVWVLLEQTTMLWLDLRLANKVKQMSVKWIEMETNQESVARLFIDSEENLQLLIC